MSELLLARFDNGRFLCVRPPPTGVTFDSAVFVGRFLYASSGMDVWRTAFREPRAAWTRLLTVELENRGRGRPRKLALKGTETDLYACGYVIGEWAVVHINTDNGRVNGVRYGVQFFCAAATRFYEGIGIHVPGARVCVRGAGDALLEVHTVQSRSVLVARPGFATYSVPLPEDVDGRYIACVADDVIVLSGDAGVMHYWISTQLAAGPPARARLPRSPRLFLDSAGARARWTLTSPGSRCPNGFSANSAARSRMAPP